MRALPTCDCNCFHNPIVHYNIALLGFLPQVARLRLFLFASSPIYSCFTTFALQLRRTVVGVTPSCHLHDSMCSLSLVHISFFVVDSQKLPRLFLLSPAGRISALLLETLCTLKVSHDVPVNRKQSKSLRQLECAVSEFSTFFLHCILLFCSLMCVCIPGKRQFHAE